MTTQNMYNVTYVKVYESTPTTVTCEYASGHMGTFVLGTALGAAITYGSGYCYPPYVYWGPGQSLTTLGIHAPMAWGDYDYYSGGGGRKAERQKRERRKNE